MNIANIASRFVLLTGLDNSEIYKWQALIDDACSYVSSLVVKDKLDDNDTKRLEMLCAVYAFRLYSLCNDENITSFTAGDVHIASPDSSKDRGDRLWREYAEKASDLIKGEKFLFGRVI